VSEWVVIQGGGETHGGTPAPCVHDELPPEGVGVLEHAVVAPEEEDLGEVGEGVGDGGQREPVVAEDLFFGKGLGVGVEVRKRAAPSVKRSTSKLM